MSGTGRGTLRDVWDGLGDPRRGLEMGSGDPWGGAGLVRGPLGKSGTGRWTPREVRDGSGDP